MKGYIVNEGILTLKENGKRAIGTCETNGFKAQIDIPINLAKQIHLDSARQLIKGFGYSMLGDIPMHVGPFAIWFDDKWKLSSWDELITGEFVD